MEATLIPSGPSRPPAVPAAAGGEAGLVARALAGSAVAWDELLLRCRKTSYLVALQLLGNREDAMDVAQDTLLRLVRSLDRFDTARSLTPWVAAITRNLVVDLVRRQKVRRADSLDTLLSHPGVEMADHSASPEANAERQELQARVARAVRELPPLYREVIVLRDYQDLTYDQIAGVLGIPPGTVMSRLHRARSLLREALASGTPPKGGEE